MVEHTAVNRGVVGSSPTRGAYIWKNIFDVSTHYISYGDIAKW